MAQHVLEAQLRDITRKKNTALRKKGLLPGNIYGRNIENRNIQVDLMRFERCYEDAGESTLVDLVIGKEKPVKVLIQDVQHDAVTDRPIHVDFYQVRMDEKLHTRLPLRFVGVAPAVKDMGGTLVKNLNELEIKCLPGDLIPSFDVDISSLTDFEQTIRVSDLDLPDTIEVQNDPGDSIILVEAPRTEEELKALDEDVVEDVASVEGSTAEKSDDTEGEEAAETAGEEEKSDDAGEKKSADDKK